MATDHVLLGILAVRTTHGYDLKRLYDEWLPGAKPLAFTQIYAALARLSRDGRVEIDAVESAGGPERTVYRISPAGQATLSSWLVAPGSPWRDGTSELAPRIAIALRLHRDTRPILAAQRKSHLDHRRELSTELRDDTDAVRRLAIEHAIVHLDADLTWMSDAEARVRPG